MSDSVTEATTTAAAPVPALAIRLLNQGYGADAWHGPDLRTATADVTAQQALWRPGPGRHNIAEITLHHAWYVRDVADRLTGTPSDPFPLEGTDWFAVDDEREIDWPAIQHLLEREHARLAAAVAGSGDAADTSWTRPDRFDLFVGITCHAVYHAGQVQLIKVLGAANDWRSR